MSHNSQHHEQPTPGGFNDNRRIDGGCWERGVETMTGWWTPQREGTESTQFSVKRPMRRSLMKASFKWEKKINWAVVNSHTAGGKRHGEREEQQGAILCLSWKMSQILPPHLSHPLHFLPTCQPCSPLMASLVEAEMGEERKAAAEPTHSQTNLHLCRESEKKNLKTC